MPKLTGPDLKALREGLLLSAQAFADRLKYAGLVPVGHVRTVQRWEEGARPVPDDIADYILEQERQVDRMATESHETIRRMSMGTPGLAQVSLLRYENESDYPSRTAPHDHRLHAAASLRVRTILMREGGPDLHLIRFDLAVFRAWCHVHNLRDDQPIRSRWAAEQVAVILGGTVPAPSEPLAERAGEGPRRIPHPRQKAE